MSALVESLFSVRETPWHGLGTIVEDAPTSKDAIELAGLDWEVESKPIFDQNGKEIAGFKANTRNTDDSILGIVSNRYQIVQNSEAFEFTDNLIGEGVRYETAGSLRNGKTIWLLAKMPQAKIIGEAVDPYLCFANTHDGTGAIKVCVTPIRVVCNNTLNLALSHATRSWSTKHVGDMAGKIHEAQITLNLMDAYMKELDVAADIYANTKISDAEIQNVIEELFPIDYVKDSQRKINNIEELRNNFYICYAMPDLLPYKNTQYGVINAIADMADHMNPNRVTTNYRENNWGRIMVGHPFVDAVVKKFNVMNAVA